ncbi:MAG: NUDIX hydrolase [Clostridiales bacterium]|nr:NUDIX hydrolase [Clostridiales bacterium]
MLLEEKTLHEKEIFRGRILRVHVDEVLLPNGETSSREVVEHPGGVCVAALTEQDELLFVRQFRYPYGKVILELPAGKLDRGEDPLDCGRRELREETGAVGREYVFLGENYPSPGYCAESIYLYATRIDHFEEQQLDENEFLDVLRIPLSEAVRMCFSGDLPDAKTQLAVLKTAALMDAKNPLFQKGEGTL